MRKDSGRKCKGREENKRAGGGDEMKGRRFKTQKKGRSKRVCGKGERGGEVVKVFTLCNSIKV